MSSEKSESKSVTCIVKTDLFCAWSKATQPDSHTEVRNFYSNEVN